MPSGRRRPSALGMYRRRPGGGRYLPARSAEASSLSMRSTPYCSTAASVSPSTARAAAVALHPPPRLPEEVSPPDTVHQSVEAALRPPVGVAIGALWQWAEAHRGSWSRSRRTCPHASLRRRYDHRRGPSLLPRSAARRSSVLWPPLTPAAPLLDFAMGLYEPRCPDQNCADGSLVFRSAPCTRAAPPTPPRPTVPTPPDRGTVDMAFTVRSAARLSGCKYVEAAGFTSCCGPRAGSLRRGS